MRDWKSRIRDTLEPLLASEDPRPEISAYKDMPLSIFFYDPASEFALRQELYIVKFQQEQEMKSWLVTLHRSGE